MLSMKVNRNNFVIIGSQRTGSTLLRMQLNSFRSIRCHGEVFLGKYSAPDGFKFFLSNSKFYLFYYKFITSRLFKYFLPSTVLKSTAYNYLDFLFHDNTCSDAFQDFSKSENYISNINFEFQDSVGFKLMYDQLKMFPFLEQYFIDNNFTIIHLTRRNKIEQYLSKIRMRISKVAHLSTSSSSFNLNSINIDTNKFYNFYLNEKKNEEWVNKKFNMLNIIELSYENIFVKFDYLLDRLGVSDKNSFDKENLLKKISNKSLNDQINNYEELLDFCKLNNIT